MCKKIVNIVNEELNRFINEDDSSNKKWYHGTDFKFKGKPKKNYKKTSIKTKLGDLEFKDFLNAFFVTDDYNWAEFYAPKTKNVYEVNIKDDSKILDVSNIVESTHLVNSPLFTNKITNKEFPFQEEFNNYAFKWLNKQRSKNNRETVTYETFKNKYIDIFNPTKQDWSEGLGAKALLDYIQKNNYDGVLFQRELAILNTNIIENLTLLN